MCVWLIVKMMIGQFSWRVCEDCWWPNLTGLEWLGCPSVNLKQAVCTWGRWKHQIRYTQIRCDPSSYLNELILFRHVFWKLCLIILSVDKLQSKDRGRCCGSTNGCRSSKRWGTTKNPIYQKAKNMIQKDTPFLCMIV